MEDDGPIATDGTIVVSWVVQGQVKGLRVIEGTFQRWVVEYRGIGEDSQTGGDGAPPETAESMSKYRQERLLFFSFTKTKGRR